MLPPAPIVREFHCELFNNALRESNGKMLLNGGFFIETKKKIGAVALFCNVKLGSPTCTVAAPSLAGPGGGPPPPPPPRLGSGGRRNRPLHRLPPNLNSEIRNQNSVSVIHGVRWLAVSGMPPLPPSHTVVVERLSAALTYEFVGQRRPAEASS
jgi:hypothetical protein